MNNGLHIWRRWQNHHALPIEERTLFYRAVWSSAWIRLLTLYLPMKWWCRPFLGEPVTDLKKIQHLHHRPVENETMKKISRAVSRCKRIAPWKITCLVEAILQRRFLQSYGMQRTVHILVQQKNGELQAHAYVMGDSDHPQNKAVGQTTFSFC